MRTRLLMMMALSLSTPVFGQIGTRLDPAPAVIPDGKMSDLDRGRLTMYAYAECATRRASGRIEKYLETSPGSEVAKREANRLSIDECLSSGQLSFDEILFRGDVYDVLYRSKFRRSGPADFTAVPPIDYSTGGEVQGRPSSDAAIALRRLAECTVRNGPAEARTLVLSNITSNGEKDAFAAVVPHMSACLAQGGTVKFSKPIFRGAIAEALYRLSVNALGTNTATKE